MVLGFEHYLGLADDCQRSTAVSGLSDMFSRKWASHQVANEEPRAPQDLLRFSPGLATWLKREMSSGMRWQ